MNYLIIFLIMLCWILLGVIFLIIQTRIIVYNKETNELIASIGITRYSINILKKEIDFITNYDKDSKIYITDEKTNKVYIKR